VAASPEQIDHWLLQYWVETEVPSRKTRIKHERQRERERVSEREREHNTDTAYIDRK
jgi:hypothetical protein